jgi:hypothetical protein
MDDGAGGEDVSDMPKMDSNEMGAMEGVDGAANLPSVQGFFEGDEIMFVHPEASDRKVGATLTEMMDSPVIVVPALADVPESSLGPVFVFTNGVQPDGARGPMGFQPDVFDTAPGRPDYTPLRKINLVTWSDDADPRLVTSAEEIEEARDNGELSIEITDVVVNMPFVSWPGGHR